MRFDPQYRRTRVRCQQCGEYEISSAVRAWLSESDFPAAWKKGLSKAVMGTWISTKKKVMLLSDQDVMAVRGDWSSRPKTEAEG
jgi:hypothetical protein